MHSDGLGCIRWVIEPEWFQMIRLSDLPMLIESRLWQMKLALKVSLEVRFTWLKIARFSRDLKEPKEEVGSFFSLTYELPAPLEGESVSQLVR